MPQTIIEINHSGLECQGKLDKTTKQTEKLRPSDSALYEILKDEMKNFFLLSFKFTKQMNERNLWKIVCHN